MEGADTGGRVMARAALGVAAFVMGVSGVVLGTDGTVFPAAAPPVGALPTVVLPQVALTPAAASLACTAAGPYRPPVAGSTGRPDDVRLCQSGSLTITEPGAVLDGWDVRGGVVVAAPDVVLRRSRVTGDGTTPYGVVTTGAGSVRIEDTSFTGDFDQAAVGGDRWSAARIDVAGTTHDGVHLGTGARLRNSTVHGFRTARGAEAHGAVLVGTADVLVEDNRIERGTGGGSAVLIIAQARDGRGGGSVVVRGNVLGGGRYTLHQDGPTASAVRITGNRFLHDAEQGPLRVPTGAVLADNSYLDGGQLRER